MINNIYYNLPRQVLFLTKHNMHPNNYDNFSLSNCNADYSLQLHTHAQSLTIHIFY